MSGISEFVRQEEEAAENVGYYVAEDIMDPAAIEPVAAQPSAGQHIDIRELLIAIKCATEKMGNKNTNKGILIAAGSVIIHFVMENARLLELLQGAVDAGEAQAQSIEKPLVSLG